MTAPIGDLFRVTATDLGGVVLQINSILERLQGQDRMRYRLEPLRKPVETVTVTGDVSPDSYLILVDSTAGNVTRTMPTASDVTGRQYLHKKVSTDGNTVTLAGRGGDLIDGAATIAFATPQESLTLYSTGTGWAII